MRHEARLDKRLPDGFTTREHLQGLARRGGAAAARARADLSGPSCPAELRYLVGWAMELHGRSGASSVGLAPVSYQSIEAWARLTGRTVTPWDVRALCEIDSVLLYPGDAKDDAARASTRGAP